MTQGNKAFQNLTIRNNFMFTQVMLMGDNCKTFLEMVLGFPIDHVVVNYEKPFIHHPEFHGIRLDIYAKDENNTHYNVEMQVVQEHIEKRIRYYHGEMDRTLLPSGRPYTELPNTYVIFICTFDPFGENLSIYNIDRTIRQRPQKPFLDGSHSIVLNTKGTDFQDASPELISFLNFIEHDTGDQSLVTDDSFVQQLQDSMAKIKQDRDLERDYMQLEELIQYREKECLISTTRSHIFQLLSRIHSDIPADIQELVNNTRDVDMLNEFFTVAMDATSFEEFLTLINKK